MTSSTSPNEPNTPRIASGRSKRGRSDPSESVSKRSSPAIELQYRCSSARGGDGGLRFERPAEHLVDGLGGVERHLVSNLLRHVLEVTLVALREPDLL